MPKYRITDGANYIAMDESGRFTTTTNPSDAMMWRYKNKAYNVLNKTLKRMFLSNFKEMDVEAVNDESTFDAESVPQIKVWIDRVRDINHIVFEARVRHTELDSEMSECDKIILDVEHNLEFGRFNACELCKRAKLIQDTMRKRRKIKNEMEIIETIIQYGVPEELNEKLDKAIEQMNSRTYRPRATKNNLESLIITNNKEGESQK